MISFVIIGRNESWRLDKCIKSVYKLIDYNHLIDYEILYVDSDSDDNSIAIAHSNNIMTVYKVTGDVNAAIARNVGARAAKGQVLFFIDGDIEIQPFNINCIIKEDQLKYDYVVGFLDDVNYTNKWKYVSRNARHSRNSATDERVSIVGGGIFIIEKNTWLIFGGMDERLKRTQDRDLSLRMAKESKVGVRKMEILGLHHTIPYKDKKRMWSMIFSNQILYKGVFIRKHLFNPHYYKKFVAEEYTLITLLIALLLIFLNPLLFLLYFPFSFYKLRDKLSDGFLNYLINRFLLDIIVLASFFFFFPPIPKYKIEKIL